MNNQYEVLSPWAEADPLTLRGISPRVPDLNGKTIGLFDEGKVAACPILNVVEQKLKERFPDAKFSRFQLSINLRIAEAGDEARFQEWIKGVDTVIAAVGD